MTISTFKQDPLRGTILFRENGYVSFLHLGIILSVIIVLIGLISFVAIPPLYTEYTDIEDYGKYNGTSANTFTDQFIRSFFPEDISDSFSNIIYSYKAENTDTYGFEAYLEFTIEDEDEFRHYILSLAQESEWNEFPFDPSFKEYNIENVFEIDIDDINDPVSMFYVQIDQAKVRKILYSEQTQTVIFVALGVYDGGGIGTNYLGTFFDRFEINPYDYVEVANSSFGVDPFEI